MVFPAIGPLLGQGSVAAWIETDLENFQSSRVHWGLAHTVTMIHHLPPSILGDWDVLMQPFPACGSQTLFTATGI